MVGRDGGAGRDTKAPLTALAFEVDEFLAGSLLCHESLAPLRRNPHRNIQLFQLQSEIWLSSQKHTSHERVSI
jgi:hypothetical protein